jgi:hypothetical protein
MTCSVALRLSTLWLLCWSCGCENSKNRWCLQPCSILYCSHLIVLQFLHIVQWNMHQSTHKSSRIVCTDARYLFPFSLHNIVHWWLYVELNRKVIQVLLDFLKDIAKPEVCLWVSLHTHKCADSRGHTDGQRQSADGVCTELLAMYLHGCSAGYCCRWQRESFRCWSSVHFVIVWLTCMQLWNVVPAAPLPRMATIPHILLFEREDKYIPYYNDYFYVEKGELYPAVNIGMY